MTYRDIMNIYLGTISIKYNKDFGKLDENGLVCYKYNINNNPLTYYIEVPENLNKYYIYTTLSNISKFPSKIPVMKFLLEANYLGFTYNDCILSLCDTNGDILLSFSDKIIDTKAEDLILIFNRFVVLSADILVGLEDVKNNGFKIVKNNKL